MRLLRWWWWYILSKSWCLLHGSRGLAVLLIRHGHLRLSLLSMKLSLLLLLRKLVLLLLLLLHPVLHNHIPDSLIGGASKLCVGGSQQLYLVLRRLRRRRPCALHGHVHPIWTLWI